MEDPPELNKVLPSFADIKAITKPSKDADLPVDVLLLTVTNCEFLACYSELKNPYRCWFDGLGYVYFSDVGESQEELKVALLRCYRNGIGPGGVLVSVKNAASVLRPKAVISVGTCSGLNPAKSKLGDVVVSAKLATYTSKVVTNNQEQSTGMRSYVSKRFLNIIKNCADGWQAPLKNPEAQQVQVYTDAEVLSGPEQVRTKWRRDQLAETNPQAMAIENEGEGLFTAAFDCQIEWLIVKGITDYADGSQLPSGSWSSFASVMAASLVAHILSEPCVFHTWPHYQDLSEHSSAIRSKEQLPSPSDAESAFLEWSQNQLCSFYNSTASRVMIPPWDRDDTMDIDEVYVQLTLLRDDRNVAGTTKERLQDYSELFASHGHHLIPKRILVYGMPGIGKSTLTKKLAVDWSRGNKEILTKFAVVLLIKLRDVWYAQDFCAMLQKAELLSAGDPMVFSQLYDYILHNQQKVLLILDGYDEYSVELSSPVYQIWKSSQLRDCTLLVTTRTWKKGELRPGSHAQFEIYGFDDWQVEKFAFKFLRDQTKVEEFTEFLDEDLRELAKIPPLLLTLVLCWKKYQGTLTSRSDLYYRFCQTLLDHVTAKTSDETLRSMDEYREELAKLGELAWQALLNDCLYVKLSNLPEDIRLSLEKFIDFGFLQTSYLSISPRREKLAFFLHKSIQEFLSALFIVWNTKNAKETLFGHLAKVDSFERVKKIDAVLKFVCEMSSEAANAVVNHVQMVGEKEGLNRMTSSEELSKDQREFELCLKSYSSMEAVGTEKVGHNAVFSKQSSTSRSKEQLPSPSGFSKQSSTSRSKEQLPSPSVPLDIQARGAVATEIYNRELKEGYGYARRVPIMIIGQARTGKTSLKKSLKGELFDPNEGSTEGIETDPAYFKVTTDIWRTGRNGEDTETEPESLLDRQLAQKLFKGLKEKERLGDPSTSGTKPSVKDFQVVEPSKAKPSVKDFQEVEPSEANSPPTESSGESRSNRFEPSLQDSKAVENAKAPSLPTEVSVEPEELKTSSLVTEQSEDDPPPQDSKDHQKVPENVAVWVEKLLKENKEFMEGDDMYSVIWDFGGQSVFYDTHPIFLTEKAIYIVTCDLSCDPESKADTPVKEGRYCEEIRDEFCEKTNFDYLDFWMSSIYSFVSNNPNRQETSSSETLPAVFLACTHADKPYTKKGNPSQKVFGDLKKIYGSLLKDVFVVDNTKSGSNDECEDIKRLREAVRSVAAKLPQMEQKIPLKWLRYEKVLYLMRKEGREKISIEDARKIASDKCGIDGEGNFRTALNFLHDQKVLINFDESPGLERMVILNPQWLVDVLKEVITFKGFNHNDENVEGLWCEFEESGILKRELLDHVWKRFIDDQNTCKSLIEMMEKFSLLCQWPSEGNTERYLVPSMLKSKPTSKFPNPGVETPSLFVKFKSRRVPPGGVPQGREPPGRVPPGLFSRLIVLFHHWVQDQVKIKHKKRNQPKPCSNYAMFRIVPEDDISAALLCYSSLIEIVFVLEGDFLDERRLNISHGIHQQLGLILEGMRKEFSWLRHMDYELCVACSVCCGEKSSSSCGPHENRGCDCLHLFSEEELKDPFCDREDDGASCRVAKEKFHLWFSSQEELEEFLRSFGGSTIHEEIIDDVNAMDLLARGLDKRIRLGQQELQRNLSYWKHLAEHFNVLRDDMMMWQHPHERSPSKKMFDLLDSANPEFSVEKLKQKLKIIKRNDLVEKLKGTATLQDLFENKIYKSICVQLDYNGSWQTLGLELGISRENRERIAIDSSTSYFQTVLEIVRTRKPYLTVKEMRDFFEEEKRRDVCNVLPEGGTIQTLLEDIECLESLSVLLDKESPGLKNWRHFARKFGVSLDECNNLKPEALSPTKTLMEHIVQVEPKLTVKTLIEALKKIGRRDVVLALTKFFLGRSRTKQDANEKSISADKEVPKSP